MREKLLQKCEKILVDPNTKQQLYFDLKNDILHSKDQKIIYPIENGIINLLEETAEINSKPYDKFAEDYDKWITGSKLSYKILKRTIWATKNEFDYANRVTEFIPVDFSGILLDVPVGTGILTVEKYSQLKKATIIAIDYSQGMIARAKRRYEEAGIDNVLFFRGDVCHLPIANNSIDILITMSGLESFKDKDTSLSEMNRVLKPGEKFIGCTYVKGKKIIKDIFSQLSIRGTKLVTDPFYTEKQIIEKFNQYFVIKDHSLVKSIWCFNCNKKP